MTHHAQRYRERERERERLLLLLGRERERESGRGGGRRFGEVDAAAEERAERRAPRQRGARRAEAGALARHELQRRRRRERRVTSPRHGQRALDGGCTMSEKRCLSTRTHAGRWCARGVFSKSLDAPPKKRKKETRDSETYPPGDARLSPLFTLARKEQTRPQRATSCYRLRLARGGARRRPRRSPRRPRSAGDGPLASTRAT